MDFSSELTHILRTTFTFSIIILNVAVVFGALFLVAVFFLVYAFQPLLGENGANFATAMVLSVGIIDYIFEAVAQFGDTPSLNVYRHGIVLFRTLSVTILVSLIFTGLIWMVRLVI